MRPCTFKAAVPVNEATIGFEAPSSLETLSAVIPTYRREKVLIETLEYLHALIPGPSEILVIDQTLTHEEETLRKLRSFEDEGLIRWIKLDQPSITRAMNIGLQEARSEIVLFLDDDIVPHPELIAAHVAAHREGEQIVAGQVLQPGESPLSELEETESFRFASNRRQLVDELMGGNFSINRSLALSVGGFDENFVNVAYRFESEFAQRAIKSGARILFEPRASIKHLKAESGGTRSFGHHLTTLRPSHSVGAYYALMRSSQGASLVRKVLARPFRAIRTKHHATHPWWIPVTLVAEGLGCVWAASLYLRGPKRLNMSMKLSKEI